MATKYVKTIDDFDDLVNPRTLAHHFLGSEPLPFILRVIEIKVKSKFCFEFSLYIYIYIYFFFFFLSCKDDDQENALEDDIADPKGVPDGTARGDEATT